MYEGLDPINRDHGNVVLIFSEQLLIRFDIHLFKSELIGAAGARDCGLRVIAKMASGTRINDYMWF